MVKTRWQTIAITILCNNKWDQGWELFLCWKGNANPVPIVFNVLPWGVGLSLSFFFKGSSLFSFGGDTHIYIHVRIYLETYIWMHLIISIFIIVVLWKSHKDSVQKVIPGILISNHITIPPVTLRIFGLASGKFPPGWYADTVVKTSKI